MNEETASFDKPETLKMINHGRPGALMTEICRFRALTRSPGLPHGAGMNGLLAICCICREIMS